MRSDEPYVGMLINLEDNQLAEKVQSGLPRKEGKFILYDYIIILEEYTKTDMGYSIKGVPYNYASYYSSRDDARFEIEIDDEKGKFDFTSLEWNEPLVITLKYRVERDLRYFSNFSVCVMKRAYANLFNIDNPCGRGNCIIKRDLTEWSVELVDKDFADKKSYLDSYDQDALIRGLFNFFMTDDFGYFDNESFKVRLTQSSLPDNTHMINTNMVKGNKVEVSDASTVSWFLGIGSLLSTKKYEEYEEINFNSYLSKIASYYNEENSQVYLDCQMAYETVKNLKECNSNECKEIKTASYVGCKDSLDYMMARYQELKDDYYGYDIKGSGNGFMLYLASEIVNYNNIIEDLGLSDSKYSKSEVYSYYQQAINMNEEFPSVIGSCHVLKATEDLKYEYGDNSLSSNISKLYSTLPDFSTFCDDIVKDEYCSLSVAKKLVCADATLVSYPDIAEGIILDTFYRHYFLSPASPKVAGYESFRADITNRDGTDNMLYLDEYGYLVYRKEARGEDGVRVSTFADLLDSYYFIYLLDKINEK